MKKRLYMETTGVEATKTIAEISRLLSDAGATRIMTEYNSGKVCALTFGMMVEGAEVPFKLPVRIESVAKLLGEANPSRDGERIRAQAVRVAWRLCLRWVQAQLAFIDTGMVKLHEVFMPYVLYKSGQTLFEAKESKFKQLPNLE